MKKALILTACALMLMRLSALAAEPYDYMHVSGCEEWISLREVPSKSAERLAKIPLDALVKYLGDANDEFFEIQYAGMRGYALRSYLAEDGFFDHYDVPMYVSGAESIPLLSVPGEDGEALAAIPQGEDVLCVSRVGGDSGEFALVRYMDKEGYVQIKNLSFLPAWDDQIIRSAMVIMPGANGENVTQLARESFHMAELSAMIGRAVPGIEGQCPVGAQLILVINDGSMEGRELKFMLPLDGCPILIAENLMTYEMSAADGERLWEIFGDAWKGNGLSQ